MVLGEPQAARPAGAVGSGPNLEPAEEERPPTGAG